MLIGVFDSGIGGLTVLRELRRAWPRHSTIYLGDTARVPYGTKSGETVVRYALQNTQYLIGQGIDLLVIACNTASAYALDALTELPVPVVGVIEPGAAAAAAHARAYAAQSPGHVEEHIGVIATAGTISSGAYERAIARRQPGVRISARACPLFVPLVEDGWEDTDVARQVAEHYLAEWLPGRPGRPQAVVLGCTHYPVLKATLAKVLGPDVALIDSAQAAARAVELHLRDAPPEAAPAHRMIVTDGAPGFAAIAGRLLEGPLPPLEIVDLMPTSPAAAGKS